jgi:hypothetical protein
MNVTSEKRIEEEELAVMYKAVWLNVEKLDLTTSKFPPETVCVFLDT